MTQPTSSSGQTVGAIGGDVGVRAWIVEGGMARLHESGGSVHVRAYSRTRDGRTEQVRAHVRSNPPGGEGDEPIAGGQGGLADRVQLAGPLVAAVPYIVGAAGRAAGPVIRQLPSLGRRSVLDWILGRDRSSSTGILNSEVDASDEADDARPDGSDSRSDDAAPASPDRPRYIVHDGRQGKHTPGHNNYDPNRSSIAEGTDPQALADEFAGRGEPVAGVPGEPGYRERFDAGERIIGTWRDGPGGPAYPTTRATIRHGAGGHIHIVPSMPRGFQRGQ